MRRRWQLEPTAAARADERISERTNAATTLYGIAADFEMARARACTAAQHFRDENVPRSAAHAGTAQGRVRKAQGSLDAQAKGHADRSSW